jgi:hypothetical protein
MSTHRITTILLAFSVLAVTILTVLALINQNWNYVSLDLAGLLLTISLFIAHLKGFKWSVHCTVIGMTLISLSMSNIPELDKVLGFNVLTPVVLAAVLLPWYWSIGVFTITYIIMAIILQGNSIIFTPTVAIVLCLQAGGIALASVVARTAQRKAEENAFSLQHALDTAEKQNYNHKIASSGVYLN